MTSPEDLRPGVPAAASGPAAEPVPVEPVPVEPVPVEAAPVDQTPAEPAAVEPAPVPGPVDPAPVEPAPVEQAPVQPPLADPARTSDAPVLRKVPQDDPAADPVEHGHEPAGRRNVLGLVAALALVGLLAAAVAFLGLRLRDEARTDTARGEATAASRDAARLLFSYDHATLDEDFQKGLAVTTGEFREEYSRTTQDVVADVAREYKAVVLADVVESAVVRAEADEVTTIVFLNQATTSTRVQGQQVDASRVRMTLVDQGGRWLVSKVEAL